MCYNAIEMCGVCAWQLGSWGQCLQFYFTVHTAAAVVAHRSQHTNLVGEQTEYTDKIQTSNHNLSFPFFQLSNEHQYLQ